MPIRKKVARTHSSASAASTFDVVAGHGPSSKVSTTSRSASGRVCGKLFRPTRGVAAGSTPRTREVPSASLRAQSAACAAMIAANEAATAAHRVLITFPKPSKFGRICHCAGCCRLGNASCNSSDEFSHSVKPARRGMAEDIGRCPRRRGVASVELDHLRCGMRMAGSASRIRRTDCPRHPGRRCRCCAPSLPNCTRPTSAT